MKGDCTLRGFEHVGKAIFYGKVKRRKKEHETTGAEDKTENDASDNEVERSGQTAFLQGRCLATPPTTRPLAGVSTAV
jgi:hypothetical protein